MRKEYSESSCIDHFDPGRSSVAVETAAVFRNKMILA